MVDPSNEMAEVLVQALEWNMLSREWNLNVRDLVLLHQKSKALLQTLKTHLSDRVGRAKGWNFEKAHSILHKVREIVMWGWAENTSCQGPEHAHIELIKSVAHLTNNKDVFLCILRFHTGSSTAVVASSSSISRCWQTCWRRLTVLQLALLQWIV